MNRSFLRVLSILLFLGGIALVVVAFVDFFHQTGVMSLPPNLFWLFFIGFPLVGLGGGLFFLSLRPAENTSPALSTTPAVDAACPYCGTENEADRTNCKSCGASLPR